MSQKNLKIYNSIWVISKENHHKLKFLPNKPKVHFRLTSGFDIHLRNNENTARV